MVFLNNLSFLWAQIDQKPGKYWCFRVFQKTSKNLQNIDVFARLKNMQNTYVFDFGSQFALVQNLSKTLKILTISHFCTPFLGIVFVENRKKTSEILMFLSFGQNRVFFQIDQKSGKYQPFDMFMPLFFGLVFGALCQKHWKYWCFWIWFKKVNFKREPKRAQTEPKSSPTEPKPSSTEPKPNPTKPKRNPSGAQAELKPNVTEPKPSSAELKASPNQT